MSHKQERRPTERAKRKPERREQVSQRQANMRARLRADGRVKIELWPKAEHVEAIRDYAASLDAGQTIEDISESAKSIKTGINK